MKIFMLLFSHHDKFLSEYLTHFSCFIFKKTTQVKTMTMSRRNKTSWSISFHFKPFKNFIKSLWQYSRFKFYLVIIERYFIYGTFGTYKLSVILLNNYIFCLAYVIKVCDNLYLMEGGVIKCFINFKQMLITSINNSN